MKHPDDVREWGHQLCVAWGLNPGEVSSITIYVRYDEYPRAEVGLLVNGEVVSRLLDLAPTEVPDEAR